jgi:hypothetical protein
VHLQPQHQAESQHRWGLRKQPPNRLTRNRIARPTVVGTAPRSFHAVSAVIPSATPLGYHVAVEPTFLLDCSGNAMTRKRSQGRNKSGMANVFLVIIQVVFVVLLLLDVGLLTWLLRLHDVSWWSWSPFMVVVGFLVYLFTGYTDLRHSPLRKLIAQRLLVKSCRLLIVCILLLLLAGFLIWLIALAYDRGSDPIEFDEFVEQLNQRREEHPAALREFAKDWEGKSIKWRCVIIEAFRDSQAYRIGVTKDAPRKNRAHASFSKSGGFMPSRVGKATIEGAIRKVDKLGIRLTDCRFARNDD